MTKIDKKKEIATKVLSIPMEMWSGLKSHINQYDVEIVCPHGNMNSFILIDGVEIFDDRIYWFINEIKAYKFKSAEEAESKQVDEIYKSLFQEL